MDYVSAAFMTASRANSQKGKVLVELYGSNGKLAKSLTTHDIVSLSINQSLGGSSSITIGSVASASLTMKIMRSAISAYSLQFYSFRVYFGYELEDGTTEWLSKGIFHTNSELISEEGIYINVEAYDKFYWMTDAGPKFPTSGYTMYFNTVMDDIVRGTGIQYVAPNFLAGYEPVWWSLYPNGTRREMISQVSSLIFRNAMFDATGKIVFKGLNETFQRFTTNDYVIGGFTVSSDAPTALQGLSAEFEVYKSDYVGAGIHSNADSVKTTLYTNGDRVSYDSPIGSGVYIQLNEELFGGYKFEGEDPRHEFNGVEHDLKFACQCDDLISPADANEGRTAIIGKEIRGYSLSLHGCPWLQIGDGFEIVDYWGKTYHLYALSITYEFNGAIKTTVSATSSAEDSAGCSGASSASLSATASAASAGLQNLSRLTVDTFSGNNGTFNNLIVNKVLQSNELKANYAHITNGEIDSATISHANVTGLDANYAHITNGVIDSAQIGEGSITTAEIANAAITNAKIANEAVDTAQIKDAAITNAKIGELAVDSANIKNGAITNVKIGSEAVENSHIKNGAIDTAKIGDLAVTNAKIANEAVDTAQIKDASITVAKIGTANITQLAASQAFIDVMDAKYVNAEYVNVSQEWVRDLFIQGQFIAQVGTAYKLTSLHIDANDITAGTLTVDRLQLLGEDGLYYQLNLDSLGAAGFSELTEAEQAECQSHLHAKSLVANSITTDQITVNNLVGTGGWINLAEGTFAYQNTDTGNWITWDKNKLNIKTDYLSYSEAGGLVLGSVGDGDNPENNVHIDDDSVDIRSGAEVLASFTEDTISLGANSREAKIKFGSGSTEITTNTYSDGSQSAKLETENALRMYAVKDGVYGTHFSGYEAFAFDLGTYAEMRSRTTPEDGSAVSSKITVYPRDIELHATRNVLLDANSATIRASDSIAFDSSRSVFNGALSVSNDASNSGVIYTPRLQVWGSGDAEGTSDTTSTVPVLIGSDTGQHIEIDSNEIMSKGSANTTSKLFLQGNGDDVQIGPTNSTNIKSTLVVSSYGNTASFGSLNAGFCHFMNSADIPFYFNKYVQVDGAVMPYTNKNRTLGDANHYWSTLYTNAITCGQNIISGTLGDTSRENFIDARGGAGRALLDVQASASGVAGVWVCNTAQTKSSWIAYIDQSGNIYLGGRQLVPVYCCYARNSYSTDHYYTTNQTEFNQLVASGWGSNDGIKFYAMKP